MPIVQLDERMGTRKIIRVNISALKHGEATESR
jgi:hypothetical protein